MRDEHMVVREARYLSGNDIGKMITVRGIKGTLEEVDADQFGVEVYIEITGQLRRPRERNIYLNRDETIEITGKKSNAEEPTK